MSIARAKWKYSINLITAVPSIETYANIKNNKYSHSRLLSRKRCNLPKHHIIDLNENKLVKKNFFSLKTLEKVKDHLAKRSSSFLSIEEVLPHMFYVKMFKCFSCPNCSINLVYHKKKNNFYVITVDIYTSKENVKNNLRFYF